MHTPFRWLHAKKGFSDIIKNKLLTLSLDWTDDLYFYKVSDFPLSFISNIKP